MTYRVKGCDSSSVFWAVVESGLMTYTEACWCEITSLIDAYDRLGFKTDLEGAFEEGMTKPEGYQVRYRRIYERS